MKLSLWTVLAIALLEIAQTALAKEYIIRFDDVQDSYLSQEQQDVIQWCMDNDVAISLGVIAGFFGSDTAMVNKVRDCLARGRDKCEVFNHGMDYVNRFGDGMPVAQIQSFLEEAHQIIFDTLGVEANAMVPHQNSWSPNVLQALRNMNYDIVSASINERMQFDMTSDPLQMPQQTETAAYGWGSWPKTPPATILAACQAAYAAGDACVIMSHPHEFGLGTVSLNDLTEMIDLLEADGWSSATFHSFASNYLIDRPTSAPTEVEPTSAPSLTPPTAPTVGPCCPPGYTGVHGDYGCLSYHHCQNGVVVQAEGSISCPTDTVFDSQHKYCNWAYLNPPCDVSC